LNPNLGIQEIYSELERRGVNVEELRKLNPTEQAFVDLLKGLKKIEIELSHKH
jgi:hypothetical protein